MKRSLTKSLVTLSLFACLGLVSCNSSSSKSNKKKPSSSQQSTSAYFPTSGSSSTIPVTGVSLNLHELPLSFNTRYGLSATVSPSNATSPAVEWSSSNENVATVTQSGVVLSSNVVG